MEKQEAAALSGQQVLDQLHSSLEGLSSSEAETRRATYGVNALEKNKSPFTRATGLPRLGVHWVRPKIVVQVAFIEWTVHGKLRHPRLLGIRTDKSPREVVREST